MHATHVTDVKNVIISMLHWSRESYREDPRQTDTTEDGGTP